MLNAVLSYFKPLTREQLELRRLQTTQEARLKLESRSKANASIVAEVIGLVGDTIIIDGDDVGSMERQFTEMHISSTYLGTAPFEQILEDHDEEVVPSAFEQNLEDHDEEVVPSVFEQIIKDHDEEEIPSVFEQILEDHDREVNPAALEQILEDHDEEVVPAAFEQNLEDLDEEVVPATFDQIIEDLDEEVVPAAFEQMLEDRDKKVVPSVFEQILEDHDEEVVPAAFEQILEDLDEEVVPAAFEQILEDHDEKVVPSVFEQVLEVLDREVVPSVFEQILEDHDEKVVPSVFEQVVEVLVVLDREVVPSVFEQIIEDNDEKVVPSVFEQVLEVLDREVVPSVFEQIIEDITPRASTIIHAPMKSHRNATTMVSTNLLTNSDLNSAVNHPYRMINLNDVLFVSTPINNRKVNTYYIWKKDESALSHYLKALLSTSDLLFDLKIIGMNTKSKSNKVEVLQLCNEKTALLIQRSSGLLESTVLTSFLLNKFENQAKVIFVGMDLIRSAMEVRLHGGADLSDLYPKREDMKRYLSTVTSKEFEYKHMRIVNRDWSIRLSSNDEDGNSTLQYLAGNAWLAYKAGYMYYSSGNGVDLKQIFSTKDLNDNLSVKLMSLIDQSKALNDLQIKDEVLVTFQNMRPLKNSTIGEMDAIEVVCKEYHNSLRQDSEVTIRYISPGGKSEGVQITGTVDKCKGKKSVIVLQSFDPKNQTYVLPVDKAISRILAIDPAKTICETWKKLEDKLNVSLTVSQRQSERSRHARIDVFLKADPDHLLESIRNTILGFIKSHSVPSSFFPQLFQKKMLERKSTVVRMSAENNLSDYCNLFVNTGKFLSRNLDAVESQAIRFYAKYLNPSQVESLERAFTSKVSVITGPPGTGKTRTIAAIAEVATSTKRRVLIIAPANTASRRILESIVAQGYEKACLIVSNGYFYEWHESSYTRHLADYIYTKDRQSDGHDDRTSNSKRFITNIGRTAHEREEADFRPRYQIPHKGKWTEPDAKTPAVVIGTHGCIANCVMKKKAKLGSWANDVNKLLMIKSIDMLIIDETSQLWEGYALGLLKSCPNIKNLILVGDDNQLAPYGEESIKNLRSLFKAGLKHSSVPNTVLNVTYRLPNVIASIISSTVYNGELEVYRDDQSDADFIKRLKLLHKLRKSSAAKLLVDRFVRDTSSYASLAWIHHSSTSHRSEGKSTGNEDEARVVGDCAASFMYCFEEEMIPSDVSTPRLKLAVLTPYIEQKTILELAISKSLKKYYPNTDHQSLLHHVSPSLVVNTIDSFQGQEADVVLISMARSDNTGLGFAKNQRRANVLLSRASQLMVIFGDANTLTQGEAITTDKLVPAMAYHASMNNSMFQIVSDTKLEPYKLVPSSATDSMHLSSKRKVISLLPSAPMKKVFVAQHPPSAESVVERQLSKVEQEHFRAVEQVLSSAVDGAMPLSSLGNALNGIKRPSEQSLLSILRRYSGLRLRLDPRNAWIVSMDNDSDEKEFENTVIQLITKAGGKMYFQQLRASIHTDTSNTKIRKMLEAMKSITFNQRFQLLTIRK